MNLNQRKRKNAPNQLVKCGNNHDAQSDRMYAVDRLLKQARRRREGTVQSKNGYIVFIWGVADSDEEKLQDMFLELSCEFPSYLKRQTRYCVAGFDTASDAATAVKELNKGTGIEACMAFV